MEKPIPFRLAYLVSQYPLLVHSYLFREISSLRTAGLDLHVISIESPEESLASMAEQERREAAACFYVKRRGAAKIVLAHVRTMLFYPHRYLGALFYALRLAGPGMRRRTSYFFYFVEAVVVAERMRQLGLHHLHTHYSSTVALIASHLRPLTLSLTIHGSDEFKDPARFRMTEKVATAAWVRTISNYGKSQVMLSSRPEDWNKISVVPLGVDPSYYHPAENHPAGAGFVMLFVGRLVEGKGLRVLFAALEELRSGRRDFHLWIVGDGPARTALEQDAVDRRLTSQVVFKGWRNESELRALYRRADAFVLPSLAEGIPVVLMEAMATGLPCIASRITGIPELITSGIEGLLVTPSDSGQLHDAIAALMDDPGLARRIGQNARLRIQREFNLARNCERLAEFLTRIHGDEGIHA